MESLKITKDTNKMAGTEKKSSKKLIPPVRQTLTSYKRMLKANPLLQYQESGVNIDELLAKMASGNHSKAGSSGIVATNNKMLNTKPIVRNELKTSQSQQNKPFMRTQSLKYPKEKKVNFGLNKPTSHNLVKQSVDTRDNASLQVPYRKVKQDNGNSSKTSLAGIRSKVNSFQKNAEKLKPVSKDAKGEPQRKSQPKSKNIRRSLSSGFIQVKNGKNFNPKDCFQELHQSQSEEQLNIISNISPIIENKTSEKLIFKTPSSYNRRSICHFTPRSNSKCRLFRSSTPAPIEMKRLQDRLNKWLKSRGKPPASFHHLKIFGSEQITMTPPLEVCVDENKENIEILGEKTDSYESLKIDSSLSQKTSNEQVKEVEHKMTTEELAKYAKEAMVELLKLIEDDYPREQCLSWLELIRDKYHQIDEEPEYWECRAAIERSVGNVHNAVEFYKTAIVQGAEVNSVDKSLDQLLEKFSLLNISPKKTEHKNGDKARIVMEARNVFKSSIIQFALRERNIKRKEVQTATESQLSVRKKVIPVRRSTRLSRSGYTNTSGVQLCTSLKEIDLSSQNIFFEKNEALIP